MTTEDGQPGVPADWRETNRAMWDERVPVHLRSAFYDLAGFRAGRDDLRGFETGEMGTVAGRRLLHLQCHIGTDTLSLARRGAEVTGLDFSAPAIEAARGLAADLGLAARFVHSDVYDAVAALDGVTYDIVYTGIGALCWLPDLARWAHTAASLVAPGGFLYLAEFHPVGLCLGRDGTSLTDDYFSTEPTVYECPGSYADWTAPTVHNRAMEWRHPLGDVVSAVAATGLRVEFLHEHDFTLFEQLPGLVAGPDTSGAGERAGRVFRLPEGQARVPLLYSLRASRT